MYEMHALKTLAKMKAKQQCKMQKDRAYVQKQPWLSEIEMDSHPANLGATIDPTGTHMSHWW